MNFLGIKAAAKIIYQIAEQAFKLLQIKRVLRNSTNKKFIMKVYSLIVLLAASSLASAEVSLRWFNVPVGHFNPLIRRFFDLRYFANDEHYVSGGPIYIYIGGGVDVYDEFITQGAMFEIARDTGGYLFALEHRYFGESKPTENTAVSNLGFLTIHQATADIGDFITFIKANYRGARNSRVILWGKGYGGALAAWTRHKFQHLVDGVWASSSPINAIPETQDFMRNTANTIKNIGGSECNEILEQAFQMMEDAVRHRDTAYLEERFRLCSPVDIDVEEDVSRLFYGIAADIGFQFVSNARYSDIDEKCSIMRGLNTPSDLPENSLDAFARWFVDEFHANISCLNYNNTAVLEMYQNVEWDSTSTASGLRQTLWLQCTQLGQFATSGPGQGHPFGLRFDFSFFHRWCADVFGEEK